MNCCLAHNTESASQSINQSSLQVHAADKDSPANAAITYYIVNGDPEHMFSVHPQHGMVQVDEALDRETVSHAFRISVRVRNYKL